jgi:DNA-directed RNA polymerase specialized sigma24 family protein
LDECLKHLGGTARRVLELKYENSHKIAEIAQRLGKSVPAIEMILVRSRRGLRECIERKISQAARGAP